VASTTPRSTNIAPASAAMAARSVDIAPAQVVVAANDTGPASGARETRVYATGGGTAQVTPLNPATSRTRGIGNRFRSAGGAAPAPKPAATTPPETYQ
jgi:type IV secretion system protein VirB6